MTTEDRKKNLFLLCAALLIIAFSPLLAGAQAIPEGDVFAINSSPSTGFIQPDVSLVNIAGDFVVVWGKSDPATDILARRFDRFGQPFGPEITVAANVRPGRDYWSGPKVASGLMGNFVVVWNQTTPTAGIYGRIWDINLPGGPGFGDPFLVSDINMDVYVRVDVAQDLISGFVVVWDRSENPSSGPREIVAQRFDTTGQKIGGELDVSTSGTSQYGDPPLSLSHYQPSVAASYSGDFIVSWACNGCEDTVERTYSWVIRCRQFGSDGSPLGAEFTANTSILGGQERPQIAIGPTGRFVVLWVDNLGGGTIRLKVFHETGVPLMTDDVQVSRDDWMAIHPAVATGDPDGHFMVSFAYRLDPALYNPGIPTVRWFDVEGTPWALGASIPHSSPYNAPRLSIAGDHSGGYVVVWGTQQQGEPFHAFGQLFSRPALLTINDFSVLEGDPLDGPESTAVFTVQASRTRPDQDIHVDFETEDGTATFLEDYEPTSGTLIFPSGATTLDEIIEVVINPDTKYELDEDFFMNLGNVANAAIVRDQGTVMILNDDPPPTLTIGDVHFDEDDGSCPSPPTSTTALFPITIDPIQPGEASIDFATSDETATAGSDYIAASGTVSIPGGYSEGWIAVDVLCDSVSENDETFRVNLANPVNALLATQYATGTIIDNDCFTIDPTAVHLLAGGCPPPVEDCTARLIIRGPSCDGVPWTAASSNGWIHDISPASGVAGPPYFEDITFVVDANPDLHLRTGGIDIADRTFVVTQDGTLCTFSISPGGEGFPAWGGTGVVTVTLESGPPAECEWVVETAGLPPWISLTSPASGFGDGTVAFAVEANPGPSRSGAIEISGHTFAVDQEGSFFDGFDDDLIATNWIYEGLRFWTEGNDSLRANPTFAGEFATALATGAFGGCIEGAVSATIRFDIYSMGTVALIGWYGNSNNHVSLTMDEFANRWTLTQKVAGVDVETASSNALAIETGVVYDAEVSFDGDVFSVVVDGFQIITMPKAPGSIPDGTVGFGVWATVADFGGVSATTVTRSGVFFRDDFESGDTTSWTTTMP